MSSLTGSTESAINQPWRVLHVVANHEKQVARHLQIRDQQHYLPLYTELSRWTDRSVTLQRPLFPGYIFVRVLPGSGHAALKIPGVLRLIGDETHGAVPCSEIERIRLGLAEGYALRPYPCFPIGTQVRIQSGLFAGSEGVVIEVRRHSKVVITLTSLEACFSLETATNDLEILDTDPQLKVTTAGEPTKVLLSLSADQRVRHGSMLSKMAPRLH